MCRVSKRSRQAKNQLSPSSLLCGPTYLHIGCDGLLIDNVKKRHLRLHQQREPVCSHARTKIKHRVRESG